MAQATERETALEMVQATGRETALEMAQVSARETALPTRPSTQLGIRLMTTTPMSSAMWIGGGKVS